MKKILLVSGTIALFSFAAFHSMEDKNLARVEQVQGLYVFQQSKPVAEYDYLGSVKITVSMSGKPQELYNMIIKKVKKEYPDADGVIFTGVDMDRADAVKFK